MKKSTVQQWQMYYNAKLNQPIVHPAQSLSKKDLTANIFESGPNEKYLSFQRYS
jgi:hypothetical protein